MAIEEAAGAADLAAIDFDVVARAVARRYAELVEAEGEGFADAFGHVREIAHAQGGAVEQQLPADLAFVEIKTAAAGDAAADLDAVGAAIVGLDLLAQELVHADQRRGAKSDEADGVGNFVVQPRLDQRLIERDVLAPVAQAGVDDAEGRCRHLTRHALVELPADLADVVALELERIGRDVAGR